jgi:hypothetical protein
MAEFKKLTQEQYEALSTREKATYRLKSDPAGESLMRAIAATWPGGDPHRKGILEFDD